MSQFNLGWIPLIQQELRKFFASKGQGDKADTALQPGAIGTTVQGYDADLANIAALNTTTFGRSLLTQNDAAAARTAIGAMANTAPEIITNANGTAYRWPNGLQICMGNGVAQATTFQYGSLWASNPAAAWTYPAAFAATPAAFGAVIGTSGRWFGFNAVATVLEYSQFSYSSQSFSWESRLVAIGTYAP